VNASDYFSFGQGYVYNFTGDSIGAYTSGISNEAIAIDYSSVTGVANHSSMGLSVYPNPCSTKLSIIDLPANSLVSIYSIEGLLVFHETVQAPQTHFCMDVNQLTKGVYMLVVTQNQQIYRSKFIKN
jgi:hypothetical protein